MANLDDLDREYEQKEQEKLISSLDFMKFVYNHDKKAFARFLYRKLAYACVFYENGSCTKSRISSNHPDPKVCEHLVDIDEIISLVENIFGTNKKNAQQLCQMIASDNFLLKRSCKSWNGGPFALVFNTPSVTEKVYWNVGKIAGKSGEFRIEVMLKTYYARCSL